MGNWDAAASQFKLTWSQGHFWRQKFSPQEIDQRHEFKFVIKRAGNKVDRWEQGDNHVYDLEEIQKILFSDAIRTQIESGLSDEVEIRTENFTYKFNRKNNTLGLYAVWQ